MVYIVRAISHLSHSDEDGWMIVGIYTTRTLALEVARATKMHDDDQWSISEIGLNRIDPSTPIWCDYADKHEQLQEALADRISSQTRSLTCFRGRLQEMVGGGLRLAFMMRVIHSSGESTFCLGVAAKRVLDISRRNLKERIQDAPSPRPILQPNFRHKGTGQRPCPRSILGRHAGRRSNGFPKNP